MDLAQGYSVVVIGGGHAGCEAALASARMGVPTLLLTQNLDTLGQLSCNPAVGGIGKSHLVREVDALDGAMARITDRSGIQFRILNARKGPAVRATRAQTDRQLYRTAARAWLENQPNLALFQDAVEDLRVEGGRVVGVVTSLGLKIDAQAVVLTAGTFLGGVVHVGQSQAPGGRAGDPPARRLAARLREMALRVDRLKTGTPPRIDARSVNFDRLEEQPGDHPAPRLSFLGTASDHPAQRSCHIAHTNERTHAIIRSGLDRSPLYTGAIEGRGPRYCPSIEDKVQRFADKTSHQIFIEPEGLNSRELYPNGISTSLPFDVQLALVRSMDGFAEARITRPGYAIEYDYLDPRDLSHTLESRVLPGLFLAGQINGTTGYEEAAAQGLLAGANAALSASDQAPWYPGRDQAYLGVMIDDLITRGTSEPYRMFTSRAEYRLMLRQDNADLRLTEIGRSLGLVGEERWAVFAAKREAIERERQRLEATRVYPGTKTAAALEPILEGPLTRDATALELLKRPEITHSLLQEIDGEPPTPEVAEQVEIDVKYAGYIDRQREEIKRLQAQEATRLPADLDYQSISGLSNELKEKLREARPETLAAAARLQGMTPAALSLLLIHLKKRGLARSLSAKDQAASTDNKRLHG